MTFEEIKKLNKDWDPGDISKHTLDNWGYFYLLKLVERQGEALRSLYDVQNGPPLLNRETQWQTAMDGVHALLSELEGE